MEAAQERSAADSFGNIDQRKRDRRLYAQADQRGCYATDQRTDDRSVDPLHVGPIY